MVLKRETKKLWGLAAGVGLFFMHFLGSPIYAQTLSEVYVSPSRDVLGAIFISNPGFSSDIFVSNGGLVVSIEMEVPRALVEVYSDGYIRLIEEEPSVDVSYESGQIRQIGRVRFHYESGRLNKISDLRLNYSERLK